MTDNNSTNLLSPTDIDSFKQQLDPDWQIEAGTHLKRTKIFDGFLSVVKAVNLIAEVATQEEHHPDLWLHSYNRLSITLSTHSLGGLTTKDFKLAREIDKLLNDQTE